jgi:glycosyltransferase involved in cell wall biosynthesis
LVSVIIASYNYSRYLGRTLQSILDQTLQNFEVVVVDDGSSDGSPDVVRSFEDPRIRLHVHRKNLGSVPTYNHGAREARGAYITYLDSDDWIEPRKIEEQVRFFNENPEIDVVGTYVNFFEEGGKPHVRNDELQQWFNQQYDYTALQTWVGDNKVAGASVMLTRRFHERFGLRDPGFAVCSDFELWARAFTQGCRFGGVPLALTNYRLHEDSLSQRDPLITFVEISYLLHKHIWPQIDAVAAHHLKDQLIAWHRVHPTFQILEDGQRSRLLALLTETFPGLSCGAYKRICLGGRG